MNHIQLGLRFVVLSYGFATSANAAIPSYLPAFYEDPLKIDGRLLQLDSESEQDGVKHAYFISADHRIGLAISQLTCTSPRCDEFFAERLNVQNNRLTLHGGEFRFLSNVEFIASWTVDSKSNLVFFARVPGGVVVWSRITAATENLSDVQWTKRVRTVVNRHRVEEAIRLGNVQGGRWASEAHDYALELLFRGEIDEALHVLKQVITWAPNNFEAHLDLAENTKDTGTAHTSALTVWENTESASLSARAARVLGRSDPNLDSITVLDHPVRGLEVVLIPLPPCDIRLLEETANLYTSNFHVPVRIARLPVDWIWYEPDRVHRHNDVQTTILQKTGQNVDFSGWTKDRYATELATIFADDNARSRYEVQSFLNDFHDGPGQYRVDPYVDRLIDFLAPFRSADRRTMFVGVTAADIFR